MSENMELKRLNNFRVCKINKATVITNGELTFTDMPISYGVAIEMLDESSVDKENWIVLSFIKFNQGSIEIEEVSTRFVDALSKDTVDDLKELTNYAIKLVLSTRDTSYNKEYEDYLIRSYIGGEE